MPKLTTPAIKKPSAAILDKIAKMRLKPSLSVRAVAAGGTFVWIEATWTTLLVDGTLAVKCDGTLDVASLLTIDEGRMTASGTVDLRGVGAHVVEARGQFLAQLSPLGTVDLSATAAVYIPS